MMEAPQYPMKNSGRLFLKEARFVGLGCGPDLGMPERSPGHPSFSCPPWVGLVHTTNLRDDSSLCDTFVQIKKDAPPEKPKVKKNAPA